MPGRRTPRSCAGSVASRANRGSNCAGSVAACFLVPTLSGRFHPLRAVLETVAKSVNVGASVQDKRERTPKSGAQLPSPTSDVEYRQSLCHWALINPESRTFAPVVEEQILT